MKSVFQAGNTIEAHLIKGLLEAEGIDAWVAGDYLQGGIGQLPALGLVEVRVASEDAGRARAIIHEYETGTPADGELEA